MPVSAPKAEVGRIPAHEDHASVEVAVQQRAAEVAGHVNAVGRDSQVCMAPRLGMHQLARVVDEHGVGVARKDVEAL